MFNRGVGSRHDHYMTPETAWQAIDEFIPKDKIIWEPFYGNGASGEHLRNLGCKEVIHIDEDFFEHNKGEVVISNPPYTKKKEILRRLVEDLDKPFILILPADVVFTRYFRTIFSNKFHDLQFIVPKKRLQFIKINRETGEVLIDEANGKCNFNCYYYCYKMNLPADLIFIENDENNEN